eukprot:CAMPEP_0172045834 /NCGR_PEP_ID=MMETSP1043-20130122/77_1 /TAXON_ID=464988 /ORGANISM="Hemiselmis andersenii, Strain CCMP441" /LENGTH=53 /DNA_ID=CAMNT_0012704429 /DNA_START=116 /DNA_END=277 /DNA_ORIENTATION=-
MGRSGGGPRDPDNPGPAAGIGDARAALIMEGLVVGKSAVTTRARTDKDRGMNI